MDRPAAAIAVLSGVLLIAASLPFAILALPQKPIEYNVFWTEEEAGRAPLQATGDSQTKSVTLHVAGHLANVTVSIAAQACQDGFEPDAPYGQKPVRVTWRLLQDGAKVHEESAFTCADVAAGRERTFTIGNGTHPDLGSLKALNRTEAERVFGAKTDDTLRDVTYTLEATWARGAASPTLPPLGSLPGVTPATTFSLTLNLAASSWDARIEEKPEVGK
ncbi:MAG: hypothetical protein QOD77_1400 [Thermoplasmata archaeon]|nr:hypothetical protein [Thermoplasmata archaeon]